MLILGAAGRDFHDFNVVFRDDPGVEVVGFTATQIPGIEGRRYPPELAGPLYPDGVPIADEAGLEEICRRERVERVVFAYSDLPHEKVMHLASRALATGADFALLGPARTMLRSARPVVAVSAVRTGCGKSQTARWIAGWLRARGVAVASLRHPMPYGDLARQRVQRFAAYEDLDAARCTAEEREEYEPYLEAGSVVFAGVDYAAILAEAEKEAQLVLWDGGNNDFPFLAPDLHVVLVDALRPDQLTTHHPGETVLRMADVVIVNKVESASAEQVQRAVDGVRALRPDVPVVRAASPVVLDDPAAVAGRRVVVVDDGPTLTHGGMPYGAGGVAATAAGAAEIVDPRPFAQGALRETFARHPHLGRVLPAMGYGAAQLRDLAATLDAVPADLVVSGTPLDLARLIPLGKRVVRARYGYAAAGEPGLERFLAALLERVGIATDEPGAPA
ncbi:MAG TPA: cyclic 2,3-diphosphoglycerate synthase [Myxococcota bacterium]|nr:cyclic 2,3-diphosphoglycerate synthase [Myxococcota bacterium]